MLKLRYHLHQEYIKEEMNAMLEKIEFNDPTKTRILPLAVGQAQAILSEACIKFRTGGSNCHKYLDLEHEEP